MTITPDIPSSNHAAAKNCCEDMTDVDCRKLTIKLSEVRVQLVYKIFGEREREREVERERGRKRREEGKGDEGNLCTGKIG